MTASLLMLPILGSSTGFVGWRWLAGLLFAPASGIEQEVLPSVPVAVLVGAVLALAGLAWGRQVQRDGPLLWSIGQHSLFLMVMSMFDWA